MLDFIRGDADSNGNLDGLNDALFILNFGFRAGQRPLCLETADADGETEFYKASEIDKAIEKINVLIDELQEQDA